MIKTKTVFVLGAGASVPYGLPTGFQLREQICSIQEVISGAGSLLKEQGYLADYRFGAFIEAFTKSGLLSIDSFLSRNDAYADIGSAVIAACLITNEIPANLFRANARHGDSDWYGLLWNCMIDQIVDPSEVVSANDIGFVTFNYDRSLEYFLRQAASSTFGIQIDKAAEIVRQIQIHHVYGSLGAFDWSDASCYGEHSEPIVRARRLKAAMNSIKVIPAQRQHNVDHIAAKMIDGADRVVFLGFGFDTTNCERLGMPRILSNANRDLPRQIFMTTYGLTKSEIEHAKTLAIGKVAPTKDSIQAGHLTSYQALREWGILLG